MRALLSTVAAGMHHGETRVDPVSGTRIDPLIGSLVGGKYRIERVLADGGMGRVYVAVHESVGRPVALKVVRHDEDAHIGALAQRRFRFEAEILAQLRHPNIVTLYDFGELEGAFAGRSYLAMELLEGPTLAERMDHAGQLPVSEVLALAEHMVRALRFAHGLGVVHRDMKPSNVILAPDDGDDRGAHGLKIVDFGTSKLVRAEVSSGRRLTQEGFVVGTPEYMAPEQLAGRPCVASDLFAVGVIMFEALSGMLPFDFEKDWRPSSPRLRELAPDLVVPDSVEALVARLLALAPEERPTSGELLEELRRCAREVECGEAAAAPEAADDGAHSGASRAAARSGVHAVAPRSAPRRLTLAHGAIGLSAAVGLVVLAALSGASERSSSPAASARSAQSMAREGAGPARAKATRSIADGAPLAAAPHATGPGPAPIPVAAPAIRVAAPSVSSTRTVFSDIDTEQR